MILNLNKNQKQALKLLLQSKDNLFLTGSAGSGKSYVIKMYRDIKKMEQINIPLVASTGVAALLVNGVTFNSFFGLGILAGGIEKTVEIAIQNFSVCERIIYTDTIIVDEVSMISGMNLQAANLLCQKVRQNKKFFGGMRVIFVGDFFQLGPFSENSAVDWVFESDAWKSAKVKHIELNEVMRTKDKLFLDILGKIRYSKIDKDVINFLNKKILKKIDGFVGPRIFGTNKQVDDFNKQQLDSIKEMLHTFQTQYAGSENSIKKIKDYLMIGDKILLKKGALVMLRINNYIEGYVNGTLGHIIGITADVLTIKKLNGEIIKVKKHIFEMLDGDGEVIAKARNFPLTLAWAITINKSQGATFDTALISLENLWLHGQAYTALSRLSNSEKLYITGYNLKSFIVDQKVIKYHANQKK